MKQPTTVIYSLLHCVCYVGVNLIFNFGKKWRATQPSTKKYNKNVKAGAGKSGTRHSHAHTCILFSQARHHGEMHTHIHKLLYISKYQVRHRYVVASMLVLQQRYLLSLAIASSLFSLSPFLFRQRDV